MSPPTLSILPPLPTINYEASTGGASMHVCEHLVPHVTPGTLCSFSLLLPLVSHSSAIRLLTSAWQIEKS